MVYVALLRGINVGGNNKVEMPRLKLAFEKAGYKNVSTYINSGNVIFESATTKDPASKIEELVFNEFGFNVPVIVRNHKNIQKIVGFVPAGWSNNTQQRTDVMFLWDEVNKPDILKQFSINPDFECLVHVDGALVWNIDRKYVNKSEMIKIVGTKLYKQMTIRNINTVRKLAGLMQD